MRQPRQYRFAGRDLKQAIRARIRTLHTELEDASHALDALMQDSDELQGYSIHGPFATAPAEGIPPYKHEIQHVIKNRLDETFRDGFKIEQEIARLAIIDHNLRDEQIVVLDEDDITAWGLVNLDEIAV